MEVEERSVWHVRRAPNVSATYFLGNMIGLMVSVPLIYYVIFLVARYFEKVFVVFLCILVVLTVMNLAIYRNYRKYPGKVFRHPTVGHAIHDGLPTAKFYNYGSYFCILFFLIASADSPLRNLFTSASGFTSYQWFLFVLDNAIKAIIFDFAEIYNLQFTDIKPANNWGKTVLFIFRTLMTISFFDFMLAINRSWKTDRLMHANLKGLRRDMKVKEMAEHTLIVAPVQVGQYQLLYPDKANKAGIQRNDKK